MKAPGGERLHLEMPHERVVASRASLMAFPTPCPELTPPEGSAVPRDDVPSRSGDTRNKGTIPGAGMCLGTPWVVSHPRPAGPAVSA